MWGLKCEACTRCCFCRLNRSDLLSGSGVRLALLHLQLAGGVPIGPFLSRRPGQLADHLLERLVGVAFSRAFFSLLPPTLARTAAQARTLRCPRSNASAAGSDLRTTQSDADGVVTNTVLPVPAA